MSDKPRMADAGYGLDELLAELDAEDAEIFGEPEPGPRQRPGKPSR